MSDNDTRTILIGFKDGTQRTVTCPANARVTFGPIAPGSKRDLYSNDVGFLALRIYNSREDQLAVFTNVSWFRDLSLQVKTRHTRTVDLQTGELVETPKGRKGKASLETETTFTWDVEEPF